MPGRLSSMPPGRKRKRAPQHQQVGGSSLNNSPQEEGIGLLPVVGRASNHLQLLVVVGATSSLRLAQETHA